MTLVSGRGVFNKLWPLKSKSPQVEDDGDSWISGDDLDPHFCRGSSPLTRRGSVRSCLSYTLERTPSRSITPTPASTSNGHQQHGLVGFRRSTSFRQPKSSASANQDPSTLRSQPAAAAPRSGPSRATNGSGIPGHFERDLDAIEHQLEAIAVSNRQRRASASCAISGTSVGDTNSIGMVDEDHSSQVTERRRFSTLTLPRRSHTFTAKSSRTSVASSERKLDTDGQQHATRTGTLLRRFSFRMKSRRRSSSEREESLENGIDVEYEILKPMKPRRCDGQRKEEEQTTPRHNARQERLPSRIPQGTSTLID